MGKIIGFITGAILLITMLSSCNFGSDIDTGPNTAEKEQQLLGDYLDKLVSEGHDIDTTDLGIYYIMVEEGDSIIQYPQTGDTLVVGYTGYFIDGSLFDASDFHSEDGKYEFVLGVDPMIEGWNDGIKKINKGATMQIIIPSEYAYGSQGYGNAIPPYSTVIFVVQIFEIRPPVTTG